MKGLKIFACYITAIKLLIAVPCFLYYVTGILVVGLGDIGYREDLLLAVILLGAIGLGYPFSLLETGGLVTWAVVAFSAAPLCGTLIMLPFFDGEAWALRAIAASCPA